MNEQTIDTQEKLESPSSMLWNLLFNVVIPAMILTKLSAPEKLGQVWALVVALAFPLSYGSFELIKNKKWNFISILGLVSVLLTGGLALFKLEGIWFAVKEAAIPTIIGAAVLILHNTKYSVFKVLMFNPKVIRVDLINEKLENDAVKDKFDVLLFRSNILFASSFLLSAILNFVLAVAILKSPTGSVEFNQELGRMTALSYPVIMVPCMIVLVGTFWFLLKGIKRITGLDINSIIVEQPKK